MQLPWELLSVRAHRASVERRIIDTAAALVRDGIPANVDSFAELYGHDRQAIMTETFALALDIVHRNAGKQLPAIPTINVPKLTPRLFSDIMPLVQAALSDICERLKGSNGQISGPGYVAVSDSLYRLLIPGLTSQGALKIANQMCLVDTEGRFQSIDSDFAVTAEQLCSIFLQAVIVWSKREDPAECQRFLEMVVAHMMGNSPVLEDQRQKHKSPRAARKGSEPVRSPRDSQRGQAKGDGLLGAFARSFSHSEVLTLRLKIPENQRGKRNLHDHESLSKVLMKPVTEISNDGERAMLSSGEAGVSNHQAEGVSSGTNSPSKRTDSSPDLTLKPEEGFLPPPPEFGYPPLNDPNEGQPISPDQTHPGAVSPDGSQVSPHHQMIVNLPRADGRGTLGSASLSALDARRLMPSQDPNRSQTTVTHPARQPVDLKKVPARVSTALSELLRRDRTKHKFLTKRQPAPISVYLSYSQQSYQSFRQHYDPASLSVANPALSSVSVTSTEAVSDILSLGFPASQLFSDGMLLHGFPNVPRNITTPNYDAAPPVYLPSLAPRSATAASHVFPHSLTSGRYTPTPGGRYEDVPIPISTTAPNSADYQYPPYDDWGRPGTTNTNQMDEHGTEMVLYRAETPSFPFPVSARGQSTSSSSSFTPPPASQLPPSRELQSRSGTTRARTVATPPLPPPINRPITQPLLTPYDFSNAAGMPSDEQGITPPPHLNASVLESPANTPSFSSRSRVEGEVYSPPRPGTTAMLASRPIVNGVQLKARYSDPVMADPSIPEWHTFHQGMEHEFVPAHAAIFPVDPRLLAYHGITTRDGSMRASSRLSTRSGGRAAKGGGVNDSSMMSTSSTWHGLVSPNRQTLRPQVMANASLRPSSHPPGASRSPSPPPPPLRPTPDNASLRSMGSLPYPPTSPTTADSLIDDDGSISLPRDGADAELDAENSYGEGDAPPSGAMVVAGPEHQPTHGTSVKRLRSHKTLRRKESANYAHISAAADLTLGFTPFNPPTIQNTKPRYAPLLSSKEVERRASATPPVSMLALWPAFDNRKLENEQHERRENASQRSAKRRSGSSRSSTRPPTRQVKTKLRALLDPNVDDLTGHFQLHQRVRRREEGQCLNRLNRLDEQSIDFLKDLSTRLNVPLPDGISPPLKDILAQKRLEEMIAVNQRRDEKDSTPEPIMTEMMTGDAKILPGVESAPQQQQPHHSEQRVVRSPVSGSAPQTPSTFGFPTVQTTFSSDTVALDDRREENGTPPPPSSFIPPQKASSLRRQPSPTPDATNSASPKRRPIFVDVNAPEDSASLSSGGGGTVVASSQDDGDLRGANAGFRTISPENKTKLQTVEELEALCANALNQSHTLNQRSHDLDIYSKRLCTIHTVLLGHDPPDPVNVTAAGSANSTNRASMSSSVSSSSTPARTDSRGGLIPTISGRLARKRGVYVKLRGDPYDLVHRKLQSVLRTNNNE